MPVSGLSAGHRFSGLLGSPEKAARRKRLIILVLVSPSFACLANEFLPEERVTSDPREYRLALNPNRSMQVGRDGTVHLVFWEGSIEDSVSTGKPSAIWYSRRTPAGTWIPPVAVDNSYTSAGWRLGGRHPTMVLGSDGTIYVFWNDYRHCTAKGNWMDNVEIYMDVCPPGGTFSDHDIRLTSTSAPHKGDNGYAPKAAISSVGEISLAWHDYHFDPEIADIFLMQSDRQGHFDTEVSIDSHRVTTFSLQSNGASPAFADVTVDRNGNHHLTWTKSLTETGRINFGVSYACIDSLGRLTTSTLFTPHGAWYFNPPQIAASPNDDIYILWSEPSTSDEPDSLFISRRRPGSNGFDPPDQIVASSSPFSANMTLDGEGIIHVVYTNSPATGVFYKHYNPETQISGPEHRISEDATPVEYSKATCCIAVDDRGQVFVAWEDYRHGNGQIYFRANVQPTTARVAWDRYR